MLANISNPAAFAVEWRDDWSEYQLVNPRGTRGLYLGRRSRRGDTWATTPVANPERFGLVDPPRRQRDFRTIAENFTTAS